MSEDNRAFVARYSRLLRKALSSKHVFAFLTRQTIARTPLTRRLFHLHLRAASAEEAPHRRIDPGQPIVAGFPIDAAMEAHLRAFSADIGDRLTGGRLTLRSELKVYEVADCEVLAWTGASVHRPTDRVIDGPADLEPRANIRVRPVPGLVLSMLGSPRGHSHYFHFFEQLTVLLRLLSWIGADEPLTLLVRQELTPFQTAAYAVLPKRFPHLRVMSVGNCEAIRPERLLIAKATYEHAMDRFALADEWRAIGGLYQQAYGLAPTTADRKLHLTRRHQRQRRISNEEALEPIFAAHGFETIAPETLSHRDQVQVMMGTCAVAAVSGAALTNLAFATTPLDLTVMCPREIDEPFWEPLALLLGCRFAYVEGETAMWNDHFAVDPARLEAALSAHGVSLAS